MVDWMNISNRNAWANSRSRLSEKPSFVVALSASFSQKDSCPEPASEEPGQLVNYYYYYYQQKIGAAGLPRITEEQDDTMRQRGAWVTAATTNQPQAQCQSPDHTHAIGFVDQSGLTPSLFTVPNQLDTRDVDNDSDNASSVFGHSICGDSVGRSVHEDQEEELEQRQSRTGVFTAVAERSTDSRRPPVRRLQNVDRSADWGQRNSQPEVGNFGLFFCNWGLRSRAPAARRRSRVMDQQLLSNPCSVLVVLEANAGLATMLESSGSVEGTGSPGMAGRPQFEYIVLRGLEESSILIAARADNCNSLECLHFESYEDRRYKHQGKERIARSRLMVYKVDFKQNIGHLGNEIVIAGVHGSRRTMNLQWQEAHKAFFDRLHAQILSKKIQFLCGDFNMSLTDVPKQLERRGLKCDCVAWYPWKPRGAFPEVVDPANTPSLGLDSCAIFLHRWHS